jgi:hypothetical protein
MNIQADIDKYYSNFVDNSTVKVSTLQIEPYGAQQFSSSGNNELIVKLPTDKIIDTHKSYLYFDVKVTGSNGEMMDFSWSCFDNHRAEIGSTEVFNLQEYGFKRSLDFVAKASSTELSSVSTTVDNYPNQVAGNAYVRIRLPLGHKHFNDFWSSLRYLPLYKLNQITAYWRLNPTLSEYTVSTAATATLVEIQNVRLEAHLIDSPVLRKIFDKDIVKNYRSWGHYETQLQNGATSVSLNIPISAQNLRGQAFVQRTTSAVNDGTNLDGTALENMKYTKQFRLNGVTKYQVFIDGVPLPTARGITSTRELISNLEQYHNVERLGDFYSSDVISGTEGQISGYYGVNFAPDNNSVSGMNLVNKTGTIVVELQGSVGATTTANIFTDFDQFIKITKNGDISITK